jgi:hypothetical protein
MSPRQIVMVGAGLAGGATGRGYREHRRLMAAGESTP